MAAEALGGDDRVARSREDRLAAFLAVALLAVAVAIIVGAVVFRRPRAIAALRALRRIGWGYVIAILLLGVIYILRDGGL